MKKVRLYLSALFLLGLLSGCANIMTGMPSANYRDASLVLTYPETSIIRDQSKVATIIVPNRYSLIVDGLPVKERKGRFNPNLRVSQSEQNDVYLVDMLPGTHKLTITYNAITGLDGIGPKPTADAKAGDVSVSASYSGDELLSWIRTSETTHTLKAGDICAVGLKLFTPGGEIDLYPLSAEDHQIIIETRNKAVFQSSATTKP